MAIQLQDIEVTDADTDRALRNIREVISDMKIARSLVKELRGVVLADGVETPVRHGVGRAVRVFVSPTRGASSTGRIDEIRERQYPREDVVVLKASGYGATVTVDLLVRAE
jgi:hypothetical protein